MKMNSSLSEFKGFSPLKGASLTNTNGEKHKKKKHKKDKKKEEAADMSKPEEAADVMSKQEEAADVTSKHAKKKKKHKKDKKTEQTDILNKPISALKDIATGRSISSAIHKHRQKNNKKPAPIIDSDKIPNSHSSSDSDVTDDILSVAKSISSKLINPQEQSDRESITSGLNSPKKSPMKMSKMFMSPLHVSSDNGARLSMGIKSPKKSKIMSEKSPVTKAKFAKVHEVSDSSRSDIDSLETTTSNRQKQTIANEELVKNIETSPLKSSNKHSGKKSGSNGSMNLSPEKVAEKCSLLKKAGNYVTPVKTSDDISTSKSENDEIPLVLPPRKKLRYKCPDDFEELTYSQESTPYWLEDVKGKDKELWLIKVPMQFDLKELQNKSVNINGLTQVSDHQIQAASVNVENLSIFLPGKTTGGLRVAPGFTGQLNIVHAPTIPTVVVPNIPTVKNVQFPSGLKCRNVPFGVDSPMQIDEFCLDSSVKKARKAGKRKHKEDIDARSSKKRRKDKCHSDTDLEQASKKSKKKKKKSKYLDAEEKGMQMEVEDTSDKIKSEKSVNVRKHKKSKKKKKQT